MRGVLAANPYGDLRVWELPDPELEYAIGVDTSSGLRASAKEGDPSAAIVIEIRTCRQVAEMHGYREPREWGWACARLGWMFNGARVAIETHPSAHGLTAFMAAEQYGYPNLWRQPKWDSTSGRAIERKGWIRTPGSTEVLMDRVRTAMGEGCIIRSEGLLDELSAMRYEAGKFASDEHDDRIIAYAIALKVRDLAYEHGEVKERVKPIEDLADEYWRRQAALEQSLQPASGVDPYDTWNGV